MNFLGIVLLVLFYFYTVTCVFFTVEVAALKGRRRRWGWLGLFFGLIGLVVVCFLPNAKGVTGETNPIRVLWRKITGAVSPVAVWIMVAGITVVLGGTLLGTRLTVYLENRSHERELSSSESEKETMTPASVTGKVAGVACGTGCNFAVTESGDLYGWGTTQMTALDESGKIYQNVQKICAAGDTIYLLTTDHVLYAKGDNTNSLIPGQSAEYVESFVEVEGKVREIALSETAGAILKESGNLYVVGVNTYGQMGRSAERVTDTSQRMAAQVSKVVVTGRSLYYLNESGEVYGVGSNAYGQFGLGHKEAQAAPVLLTGNCVDLAAGEDFLLVLKNNGTLWSAGSNCFGQLGREPESEEEPGDAAEAAEENAVSAAPEIKFGQIDLEGVTAVYAGGRSAFAMIGTEVYAWGQNHLGQLGTDGGNIALPKLVHRKAVQLAAGGNCTLLVTEEGRLMGAGDRRYYQLGTFSDGSGFQEIAEIKEAEG